LRGRPHTAIATDAVAFLVATISSDRRAAVALLYEAFQMVRAPITVDAAFLHEVQAEQHRCPH